MKRLALLLVALLPLGLIACGDDGQPAECGNGLAEGAEVCDGSDLGGATCTSIPGDYTGGSLRCSATCTYDLTGCTGQEVCGNGVREGIEPCDGNDLGGQTCVSVGDFYGGPLSCADDCTFDTRSCLGGSICGNALRDGTELCDGGDLGGATCATVGDFSGGELGCAPGCQAFDTDACVTGTWTCDPTYVGDGYCDCGCGAPDPDCADGTVDSCEYCDNPGSCSTGACPGDIDPDDNSTCAGMVCGDGLLLGTEPCDGTLLGGADCGALGFSGGDLACTSWCTYDLSGCLPAVCGDGVIAPTEVCDGSDLGEWSTSTCPSLGFGGGEIGCLADCSNLDLAGCTDATPLGWTCAPNWYGDGDCDCGCGIVDVDCASAAGSACDFCNDPGSCAPGVGAATCPGFIDPANNAQCITPSCGDGVQNGLEDCDGADLGGWTCLDLGFLGGTLACATDCAFDAGGCSGWPVCGDGTIDGNEQCDGDLLQGETCASLGFTSGTLGCRAGTCQYDTTGCVVPSGWTCVPGYFLDGECDCGCGVVDADCADATLASCEWCNDEGSCSDQSCGGNTQIDPANNAVCLP